MLVPALVREIELRFDVDDAAIGIWYFVNATAYAAASFAGGLLTERLGRRAVLPTGGAAFAVGLALCGLAPSWPVFLIAALPMGAGAGAIDSGMNALVLAVTDGGRGRALNLLHVFVGVGALSAPAAVGQLVERGLAWEAIFGLTGAAVAAVAIALWRAPMPSGRREHPPRRAPDEPAPRRLAARSVPVPLVLLALAIGCYVAGEVGVSNWVVRFLDDVPLAIATLGLSAFWAGLAVGRLAAALVSDRFSHRAFAAWAAIGTGAATILAVAAPTDELAMAAFALAGFASGPVFPMIMAIGGDLYPDRLAATTGTLTGAAVVGGMLYPPLVGLMSATFGIATGLVGAGLLSMLAGVAIVAAGRSTASGRSGLRSRA